MTLNVTRAFRNMHTKGGRKHPSAGIMATATGLKAESSVAVKLRMV